MKYLNVRRDANHFPIVAALQKIGCKVIDLSAAGGGIPDLIVSRWGYLSFVEIKNLKGRGNKLTRAQEKFHRQAKEAGMKIHIVTSVDEALAIFGVNPDVN